MNHSEHEEMVAAYALGAFDDIEARSLMPALIDHVATCASCGTLLTELRETAGDLALAADPLPVRAELEERVMKAVRGEKRATSDPPARRPGRLSRVVLVAAVIGALAFGTISVELYASRNNYRQLQRAAGSIINDPSATRSDLCTGAPSHCAIAVLPDGHGVLIASHLPPLPSGRVFELWVLNGTTATPARVFGRGADQQWLLFTVAPGAYDRAAITVERAPNGAQHPTGPMIFSGALST